MNNRSNIIKKLEVFLSTSPIFAIGIVLSMIFLVIAVFAPFLSQYTLKELTNAPFSGAQPYQPPSVEHPLGTIRFGYDLAGIIIYGIRHLLLSGFLIVLTGLCCGLIIGFIFGFLNIQWGKWREDISTRLRVPIVYFYFGWLIFIPMWIMMFGEEYNVIIPVIGVLFIPSFVQTIRENIESGRQRSNSPHFEELKNWALNLVRDTIPKIFFFMGIAFIVYMAYGVIGLEDNRIINFGGMISRENINFSTVPLAVIIPIICLIFASIGSMILGIGLKSRLDKNKKVLPVKWKNRL